MPWCRSQTDEARLENLFVPVNYRMHSQITAAPDTGAAVILLE